jgi:hypothetical protein
MHHPLNAFLVLKFLAKRLILVCCLVLELMLILAAVIVNLLLLVKLHVIVCIGHWYWKEIFYSVIMSSIMHQLIPVKFTSLKP